MSTPRFAVAVRSAASRMRASPDDAYQSHDLLLDDRAGQLRGRPVRRRHLRREYKRPLVNPPAVQTTRPRLNASAGCTAAIAW